MQFFGNVASAHGRMVSKSAQEGYYEFRLFESQRGADADPCLYTVQKCWTKIRSSTQESSPW